MPDPRQPTDAERITGHFIPSYLAADWVSRVLRPPDNWPRGYRGVPLEPTEEARMLGVYARAMAPSVLPALASAAPIAAGLVAASPPFVSYAVSPATRARTAVQAQQLRGLWDWFSRNLPLSVPALFR